ncbi:hypothetical protein Tco_0678481 [Tanacetum coccineum]|uniref:Aminotransferase-like plant mobile domain-containing protein n=1 Tax=Tanacetum coccineum TaxID=301880 RepID=A0ABQ4XF71_9ASTR
MANQEQNPPQQEQPFVAAKQVSFNLEDIILNTNNEVALLYLEHTNQDFFKCVSDFICKCFLREPFTRSPNMYKEYLAEFWYSAKALENSKVSFSVPTGGIYGEVWVNTFRNAIGAHYLPHFSEYVAPPSIDIVRPWFETIGVNNWALKPNQPEEPLFTDHMLAICNAAEPVVLKAPKPSSNAERFPQGTKPGAKPGHKKHSTSSKQPSVSRKEATKAGSSKAPTDSKTGHLKRKKESSLAMDSNPSQTSASTLVVAKVHKEDQQATGGPTSLGVTSEARANPQLSSDQTKYASEGLETVLTQPITGKRVSSIARQVEKEEASSTIKLEDLAKLVSNVQPSFKDLDSPEDDHVIVVDDSDEDEEDESQKHKLELEKNKDEAEAALLEAQPTFLNVGQLNELLVKSLQTEFSKILSAHDFSSSLPTELKDLPSKFNELTEEVKGLKKQVHELKIYHANLRVQQQDT